MTIYRILRPTLLGLGIALALPLQAQEAPAPSEDATRAEIEAQGFRLPPALRQIEYREANPWVLHTNVRYGSADSKISFGGIGTIDPSNAIPGADLPETSQRLYDDGRVFLDTERADQTEPGTIINGDRYQTFDSEGKLTGDYVTYNQDRTRDWAYANQSQYDNGVISMNQFSTQSTGTTFNRDAESSGAGFEMAVSRRVMRLGRKMELSLSASMGFSDFSAKNSENFTADLITMTDRYQAFGAVADAPYIAPDFGILSDPDTGRIIPNGRNELTAPIQQTTPDRTYTTTPGGATMAGNWSIDGGYYSFRMGPEIRGHLTEKIAFTAGAGLLGAVIGSDFTVVEQLQLGDYNLYAPIRFIGRENVTEILIGYYAEVTAEYWITQRTGFFLGAVIESLDDFVQNIGGRTAGITVGDALVFRVGIVHRF